MDHYGLTDETLINPLYELRDMIEMCTSASKKAKKSTIYGLPVPPARITYLEAESNGQVAVYVVYSTLYDIMRGENYGGAMA